MKRNTCRVPMNASTAWAARSTIAFDEQPLWRWAVLKVHENQSGTGLRIPSEDKHQSQPVNALIAKARECGPKPTFSPERRLSAGKRTLGSDPPNFGFVP